MEKIRLPNNTFVNIIKCTAISFSFTIVLFLLLSICLSYTKLSENIINPAIIIVTTISIFFGSIVMGRNRKDKGMLFGGICACIYIFILYITSSIASKDFSLNMISIVMISFGIIFGMIGGMIGINSKTK